MCFHFFLFFFFHGRVNWISVEFRIYPFRRSNVALDRYFSNISPALQLESPSNIVYRQNAHWWILYVVCYTAYRVHYAHLVRLVETLHEHP